ncbi:MAG: tetratricopeptide repeat protein [Proteobacteria bacterium]|nr:tetratricopeptide repeat protein [Pseudomonadota bacterium]
MIRQWIRSHPVHIFICLGLALIVILPFYQASQFKFVIYDDSRYILGNKNIQTGFDRSSVSWAFTTLFASNWQPLTWLSLMLDYKMYGTGAGGYHVTNVLIHLVNTLLLFFIFARITGGLWKSGFVAALFAVHPLHVESVAWVMARKDVLSAMFWLLTMAAYAYYADNPSFRRYVWVFIAFGLGLMSKPMLVTLPFVLLLLDFWPLRRFQGGAIIAGRRLILEKIPLIALSAAISAITIYAQDLSGALTSFGDIGLSERMVNAVVSYGGYVAKMLLPVNLACFYPYPTSFPISVVLLSGSFLGAACFFSFRYIRTAPYLAMGWLWYLITLLPVSGIIQVGVQAMADRYTYIPLIGLFIAIAWGIPDLLKGNPFYRYFIPVAAGTTILLFVILTYNQTGVWKDSGVLFEHAIAVTEGNYVAHNNLGIHLLGHKRFGEAASHFEKVVQIKPGEEKYLNNLGIALSRQKRYEDAMTYYLRAIAVNPRFAESYYNAADVCLFSGRENEALAYYKKALHLRPGNAAAENNVAEILIRQEKLDEAIIYLRAAIKHHPDFATARNTLAVVLTRKNQISEAIDELNEALRINPRYTEAINNLSKLRGSSQTNKNIDLNVR